MSNVLVVAPHPDDETLGCGGTLMNHISRGDTINWLIMTSNEKSESYSEKEKQNQEMTIKKVRDVYSFEEVHQCPFKTSYLDIVPKVEMINEMSEFINKIKPEILYLPFSNDAHSDHGEVFRASIAFTKSFRYPFIKKVRVYETLSETDFNVDPLKLSFKPNLFVDISKHLEKKIEIMRLYDDEISDHPFPRSEESIKSLAILRGSIAGCQYAESFISLKEVLD